MGEVFRTDTIDLNDWGSGILSREHKDLLDSSASGVVLHDRLMTDALGSCTTMPIKTEHSYSLASDGDSLPDSPISHEHMDDMDDSCFSNVTLNQKTPKESNIMIDVVSIKDEPQSDLESPNSSCPASPTTTNTQLRKHEYHIEIDPMLSGPQSLLKHNVLLSRSSIFKMSSNHRVVIPKIKLEPGFTLPPTPPSCSSSEDSEDNATSQPGSPGRPQRLPTRIITQTPTRQPIHTPLISSQPKGSTGQLMLTEEEKRTLLAEGYPVPTRLPLTKAEEKSLKKIRRKIKNKISAQESRRKKKEYMDQLERKVELLVSENCEYRKKIESLEDSNTSLLSQLAKLQAIIARTHPTQAQTQLLRHKN